MEPALPKTVGNEERARLVGMVSGVLAGVYGAGLLDGFFAVYGAALEAPQTDVMVSLVMHVALGLSLIPLAAAAAYGWMPLRWEIQQGWRRWDWPRLLFGGGVAVVLGVGLVTAYVWKRGIILSAIDYRPLGLLGIGILVGVAVTRLAMMLGPWRLMIPLLAAAIGLLGWFGVEIEQTGAVIERLTERGLTSKLFAKQLRRAADSDGDGFPARFCEQACDCDDRRFRVNPVAVEVPDNGLDDDCVDGDLSLASAPTPPGFVEPGSDDAAADVAQGGLRDGLGDSPNAADPAQGGAAGPSGEGDGAPAVADDSPDARPSGEGGAAPGETPMLERPNVLLITIDTLRADHLGAYGYERPTSPVIDKLAREGVIFEQSRSQGPMTCFSVPVLMTGRYFTEIKRTIGQWPVIHKDNRLVSEMLLEAGYHTAAVHSIGYFVPLFQFDQGFLYYDASIVRERAPTHWNPTSDLVTDKTLAYFDRVINTLPADQPWFFWAYYGDPHSGYIKHKGVKEFGSTWPDIYDHEILYTDIHIGRLLEGLRQRDELDTTLIIITADHGEGIDREKDHGFLYHGQHLFDNLLRVPLIVWGSGVKPGRVKTPVGNIDVLPTILELTGAEVPVEPALRGNSLVPFLRGERPQRPPVFAEKTPTPGVPEKAMIQWPWKIIWRLGVNRFELYNLSEDPRELSEVSQAHPEVFAQMKRDIQLWRATVLQEVSPIGAKSK